MVAVSHFGSGDLPDLVDSMRANVDPRWHLVALDNSDDDAEWADVVRACAVDARCRPVRAPRNLGYLGGARHALATLGTPLGGPAWTVVLNTDVSAPADLVSGLLARSPVTVVAPRVWSLTRHRDQNPYLRSRPTKRDRLRWRAMFAVLPVARAVVWWTNRPRRGSVVTGPETASPASADVYAPHGSCLVLPRAYFERGGDLTHGCFLFGEEITIAERCRELGIPVRYDPSLCFEHREHASTGTWRSPEVLRWQRESVRYVDRLLSAGGSVGPSEGAR